MNRKLAATLITAVVSLSSPPVFAQLLGGLGGGAQIGGQNGPVNINAATTVQLQGLGFPQMVANNILAARQNGQQFANANQLLAIPGVDPQLVANLTNAGRLLFAPLAGAGGLVGGLVGTVGNVAGGAVNTVGNVAGGATNTVGNVANGAVGTAGNLAGGAVNTVGNVAGAATNTVGNATGTVGNVANGAVNTVGGAAGNVGNVANGAVGTVGGAVGTVGNVANGAVGTAGNLAGGAVNTAGGALRMTMATVNRVTKPRFIRQLVDLGVLQPVATQIVDFLRRNQNAPVNLQQLLALPAVQRNPQQAQLLNNLAVNAQIDFAI